jgi:hypothetical protein
MHRKTLLLVGDIRDAVVVTSAFFLQEFLFALRKRFAVEGWTLCSTLGLTGGGRGEVRGVFLDLGFVAFIFCRVLRELKNIVVVARWLCTRSNSMQYSASSEGI